MELPGGEYRIAIGLSDCVILGSGFKNHLGSRLKILGCLYDAVRKTNFWDTCGDVGYTQ